MPPDLSVLVITKGNLRQSNSNYAQGGIAAVTSREDSFELHVRDTLEAGAGLCKEEVVRTIIEEGPARVANRLPVLTPFFALGAFFAGMMLAESELSSQAASETLPLRDAFAVLFFVSVGMFSISGISFETRAC